jgi:2'-5' RNA ligase
MPPPQYAVVAYVRNDLGSWVEELRREIHPEQAHLPAHMTILPPRLLGGTESHAISLLADRCRQVHPFDVTLGDVETFVPTTPTIFLRVSQAAYKMRELHDRISTGVLEGQEPWPYMPHLTIAKFDSEEQVLAVKSVVEDRWAHYDGGRRVHISELMFVREGEKMSWQDVAAIPLGREVEVPRLR